MKGVENQVYRFPKDNALCCTARPGEILLFKTLDCFSNRITGEDVTMKDLDCGCNVANPAVGPVYIEGAELGNVIGTAPDGDDVVGAPKLPQFPSLMGVR